MDSRKCAQISNGAVILAERCIEELAKRCAAPPGDDTRATPASPRPPQGDSAAGEVGSAPPSSVRSRPASPDDEDDSTAGATEPSSDSSSLEHLRKRAETELAIELAKHVLLPVEPVRRLALRLLTQLAAGRHAWLQGIFQTYLKSAFEFVPPKKGTQLVSFPLANQLPILVCFLTHA